MSDAHRRKKQPEMIRQRLLDHGARVCAEVGVVGLSLQTVADRAGVTKGGLMHHFPTKQALVEAIFDEILGAFEGDIRARMENDPEPHGRFVRAYVSATLTTFDQAAVRQWSMILIASLTDPTLQAKWAAWLSTHLERDREAGASNALTIARYAADGLWLGAIQGERPPPGLVDGSLQEALIRSTLPSAMPVSAPPSSKKRSPSRRPR